MRIVYDPKTDIVRITFRDSPIEESDEVGPGVIFDYDRDGSVVGLEVLDASERMEDPGTIEYGESSPGV